MFQDIISKYPDRIPVIVSEKNLPALDKHKFLAPRGITMGQFLYVLRRRMHLSPEMAMYAYVNGVLPANSEIIASVYEKHKSDDACLDITVCGENTFG